MTILPSPCLVARLIVKPPHDAGYDIENSPIVGNVSLLVQSMEKLTSLAVRESVSVYVTLVPRLWLKVLVHMVVNT